MPNKVENAIIWTAFAISLFWLISSYFDLLLFTRNGFLGGVVFGSCILLTCFYAMYWSFDIRHGLSSKIYRNQALGMALIALVLALFDFLVFMDGLDLNPVLNVTLGRGIIGTSLGTLVVVVLAYWIDVSIRATQRSDPLLRDPLQWKYVRWILWGMVFVFEIVSEALILLLPNSAITQSIVFAHGGGATILMAIFCGIVYIPLSLRISPDKSARAHFEWFVLFLASIFIGFFVIGGLTRAEIGLGLAILFGSYCLYRSARALGRLEHREVLKTA
jgi:hypothetical protein